MEDRVYLKDGIIIIEANGDQDVVSVERMGRQADELITEQRRLGSPALILDNITNLGQVGPEARKLVVELGKRLEYDRVAMVGKGGIMRFGTNLMLRATGKAYKLRFFEDELAAIKWLREAESR